MVRVFFFAGIREITRAKETAVAAGSVEELLAALAARYGRDFERAVYGPQGVSREAILILNGRHLAHLPDGLKTKLVPGDTVSIFPLVAGG